MAASSRRLFDVFPPGFDTKSTSCSLYSFIPQQLYHTLTNSYTPEKHIESIVVRSVWYGKQTNGVQHEFILAKIEDIKIPLTNYIVLDRTVEKESSKKVTIQVPFRRRRTASSIQSYRGAAVDAFKVSYNGSEEQLLDACKLVPHQNLEEIEFSGTNPLYLYQLVTLVQVVSEKSKEYDLSDRNCYWFASLIWECLRLLRPDARYDCLLSEKRGRLSVLRCMPKEGDITEIRGAFEKRIGEVDVNLSKSRKVRLSA